MVVKIVNIVYQTTNNSSKLDIVLLIKKEAVRHGLFKTCFLLQPSSLNLISHNPFFFFCLQRDEGITIVVEAICSGIFNDLGSGSNVDVCVITKVCSLEVYTTFFFFLGKSIRNLVLVEVSPNHELLAQGHKEYLRNHLLPNPRTFVNPKGFTFPKKIGQ